MRYGPAPVRSRLATSLAVLALLALVVAQLWPGLSNGLSPPISWDHGSHLGKAMLTAELLPSLRGWTDLVECGVPLNTLYSPTGTIWILLFRLFTPFLEWHQTYALAIVGFRFMVALCVYRLARAAGASPLAAMLAGVLALADTGDHSEGGWFYDVLYGVWPMSLAMCFFFLAFAELLELVEGTHEPRALRRKSALAMVLLGIALFSHQMALVTFGLVIPVLVLVRALSGSSLRTDLVRMLPVTLVAGLVAAWWMVPMLSMSGWLEDHGQLYIGTDDMGGRMVAGEGILRGGAWTGVLVAIGLGIGMLGRPSRRTLAFGALIVMIAAASGWFLALDASRFLPPLGRLIYPRLMMAAKPMVFALVGCALHDLFERVRPALRAERRSARGRVSLVLGAALLLPFVPSVPSRLGELLVARDVPTTASLGTWNEWQAAWAWVRGHDDDRFWRVAYFTESTHLPQAAGAYSGRPGHITGALVGESFRNNTDSTHPDALRAMNVRYVVTEGPASGALAGAVAELEVFGLLHLYELRDWSDRVVDAPLGEATPSVSAYENERVVFAPNGARSVVVRRAIAPGWHAYADGVEIAIDEERVFDSPRLRLMRLELPEGVREVEIAYSGFRAPFVLGWLLTMLGLAIAALTAGGWERLPAAPRDAALARATALRDRLWSRLPPRARSVLVEQWPALVCAAPFLALALAVSIHARGAHLPRTPFSAHVERVDGSTLPCDGGGVRHVCAGTAVERVQVATDGVYHSCLSAWPIQGGTLVLEWDEVPMTGTLRIGAGVDDQAFLRTGEPIEVTTRIDGGDPSVLRVPLSHEWVTQTLPLDDGGIHDVRIEVRARDTSRRWLCLDAVAR
jgi:hypothetical protein